MADGHGPSEVTVEIDGRELVAGWRQEAQSLDLPAGDVDRMTVAFESDQRQIARTLTSGDD